MSVNNNDMPMTRERRTTRGRNRDVNFIPAHQAKAFESELDDLVIQLSETEGFKGVYQSEQYKSKYCDESLTPADVRRKATIDKFRLAELTNCTTNQRIQLGDVDFGWVTSDRFQLKVKDLISTVLGPLTYPEILFHGDGHTNGASTRVKRSSLAAICKHTGKAHVSSSCLVHWLNYASNSLLSQQDLAIQENSVFFTVPKKTDIDRGACKEPEINMLLQRSVGTHIRRRLRRAKEGINLNDQSINRDLAKHAVRDGLATIDLSAASDSITRQLVIELLPFDWWSLLDDLRVHSTEIDGEIHELEMFSSMGNGFTFELESLIFWAIAKTVKYFSGIKGKLSVYGDDIIVPCTIAPRLARLFSYYGFKVNSEKSFWAGEFRESCGGHYYKLRDVTPFFLKEPIRSKTDIIRSLNQLLEWDGREYGCFINYNAAVFHRKWSRIIPHFLHGGPDLTSPNSLVTGDRPRKRLLSKMKKVNPIQSNFVGPINIPHGYVNSCPALLCWFTKKAALGKLPLAIDVRKEAYFIVSSHNSWTVHTTWTPYLILE